MKRLALAVGTRPEVIKLWPVLEELKSLDRIETHLVFSGQHTDLLRAVADPLGIEAQTVLQIERDRGSLSELLSKLIASFDVFLSSERIDGLIVHGDTSTALGASQAAFLSRVPVFHVEAGLRTFDLSAPFPEELNRQMIARLAQVHFAPTSLARENLIREGIPERQIIVTGNTVVDALLRIKQTTLVGEPASLKSLAMPGENTLAKGRFGLITLHRRENAGKVFERTLSLIRSVATSNPSFGWIFPVHPNPAIRLPALESLASIPNVSLVEPLDYLGFIKLLDRCEFAITDSGGLQEEGVTLGKKIFVARIATERPEGLQSGICELLSNDPAKAREQIENQILDPFALLPNRGNPFGEGKAGQVIAEHLRSIFQP